MKKTNFVFMIAAVFIAVSILLTGCAASTPSDQPKESDSQGEESGNEQNDAGDTEELVYDKDGLEIYFLGFAEAPYPAIGYYINLRIENTSDIDHTIQVRDVSADGIMVPLANAIFSAEVLSGKTLNDHIWISNTEQLGIEKIMSSVDLKFAIYNGDDVTTPETSDTITLTE